MEGLLSMGPTPYRFCRIEVMTGIKIALLIQKFQRFSFQDYSALWHCRNYNLTAESPKISTRRPQTRDKGIGTLCHKCHTKEVFDGSHLSGKIEES